MQKNATIFLLLFGVILCADEVKSFATQKEQIEYVNGIKENILPESGPMASYGTTPNKGKTNLMSGGTTIGRRGKFLIIGKVVDDGDNLLQGVKAFVSKSSIGYWKSTESNKTYILNNYFVILLTGCDSVYINLYKDDYISMASVYCYGYNSKMFHETQKSNIAVNKNTVVGNNLKFVMKKQGTLLQLQKFRGQFEVNKNGQDSDIFLIKSWKKSIRNSKINEPYLQIKSKATEANLNAIVLELVNAKSTDGFILSEFDKNAVTYRYFWRLMGEAPKEEYSKKFINIRQELGTLTFFYYYINGKYGKGHINRQGRFVLYQNSENKSDMKRNLWTKEDSF